jgi:pimeloyl-ACP methyl ester carboxylesterase
VYPEFFKVSQFPQTAAAVDQYLRQRVQDAGPEEQDIVVAAVSAIFDRLKRGILVTHSQSGKWGFITAARTPRVKGVVSFEPGTSVVPDDYVPKRIAAADPDVRRLTTPIVIPAAQFAQLTKIPIHIMFGDNVPTTPSPYPGLDMWRVALLRAQEFCELVNARGGQASLLHLPEIGVLGNTHFPFSDLNNVQIANLFSGYLSKAELDGYS